MTVSAPKGRVTNDMLRITAENLGVCVRPLLRRLVDTETGEDQVVPIPCGSTRERVCKPCASKARRIRMQQCREGWHRATEFPVDAGAHDEPSDDPDPGESAETDGGPDENDGRKQRTTRRREDAQPLPTVPMDQRRTVGNSLTSPNGRTYRPSMFVTLTLRSYGPVHSDGTPRNPATYDYARAARDAIHFSAAVDRFWQNLRRCAGFNLQYFSAIEPQRRLALHLHAAVRGVVTASIFRQVVAATYHQVWWPPHDTPVYTGSRFPEWDESAGGYVDPYNGRPLATWQQAMAGLDHPDAKPAHVVWFGSQADHKWFLAGTSRADRRIGYLTKYLTKSIADTYDPGSSNARQTAHRERLHQETRWLPCSTRCGNWLRFGIQPKDAGPGLVPGECAGKAHSAENLGHGGRRVLVSRKWSGKRLSEHRADRAEVVRQTLAAAGIEMPDQNRCSATAEGDDGGARYVWEPVDPQTAEDLAAWREVTLAGIRERLRWRAEYDAAKNRAGPANKPGSATRPEPATPAA